MRYTISILLLLLVAGTAMYAQSAAGDGCGPINWQKSFFWSDSPVRSGDTNYLGVVVDGAYAYATTEGGRVHVYRIDSQRVTFVNSVVGGYGSRLSVHDTILFARSAEGANQSYVWLSSIADPAAPVLLRSLAIDTSIDTTWITGAAYLNGLLYTTRRMGRNTSQPLQIIDPFGDVDSASTFEYNGGFADVRVMGADLLLRRSAGARSAFLRFTPTSARGLEFVDSLIVPDAVVTAYDVDDEMLVTLIRMQQSDSSYAPAGLRVYSFSSTSSPRLVGSIDSISGFMLRRIDVSDSLVVMQGHRQIGTLGPSVSVLLTATIEPDGTIRLIDTLVTSMVRETDPYGTPATWQPAISGRRVTRVSAGSLYFDTLSTSGHFASLSSATSDSRVLSISGSGSVMNVLTTDSLHILRPIDPYSPTFVSSMPIVGERVSGMGDRLFVFDSTVNWIDASDLARPRIVARGTTGRNAIGRSLASRDSLVGVACLDHGVSLLVRHDTSLVVATRLSIRATDLAWYRERLYVVGLDGDLEVWRFSDDLVGELVERIQIDDRSLPLGALSISGDTLVVGGVGRAWLFRVSSVDSTRMMMGPYMINDQVSRIELAGNHVTGRMLYLTTTTGYMASILLHDSTTFTTCGGYHVGMGDASFQRSGEFFYVPGGDRGMALLWTERKSRASEVAASEFDLSILPNPATDRAMMRIVASRSTTAQIDLYEVTGRHYRRLFEGRLTDGEHFLSFDLDGIPNGSYYVRASIGGALWSMRLQVMNR